MAAKSTAAARSVAPAARLPVRYGDFTPTLYQNHLYLMGEVLMDTRTHHDGRFAANSLTPFVFSTLFDRLAMVLTDTADIADVPTF